MLKRPLNKRLDDRLYWLTQLSQSPSYNGLRGTKIKLWKALSGLLFTGHNTDLHYVPENFVLIINEIQEEHCCSFNKPGSPSISSCLPSNLLWLLWYYMAPKLESHWVSPEGALHTIRMYIDYIYLIVL